MWRNVFFLFILFFSPKDIRELLSAGVRKMLEQRKTNVIMFYFALSLFRSRSRSRFYALRNEIYTFRASHSLAIHS